MKAMHWTQGIMLVLAASVPPDALAVASCSVTAVSLAAVSYTGAALSSTGSVDYTCTRQGQGADGSSISVEFTANAGQSYAGSTRNGSNGSQRVPYSLATTSAWGDGVLAGLGLPHPVSVAFARGSDTMAMGSFTFTFDMAASLTPLAGLTYTDTVTIGGTCAPAKASSSCSVTANSLAISISVPVSCSISTPPGNVSLGYTSFQATPGAANVSFAAQCSNGGPYRMSLSPAAGTVLGVNYSLKLGTSPGSATDISSTTTYNLVGTGFPATYYVNATAAAAQSGVCGSGSCLSSSPPHTLTVEY